MKTLDQKIAEIDLAKYPPWYRERLEAAIKWLGVKWQLHPVHSTYRKVT